MTVVSPFVTTGQEAGLSDTQMLRRLRELMDDVPKPAEEQASGLGNALRYNFNTVPIIDDSETCELIVGSTKQQIIQTPDPAANSNQAYVNFDTGRVIFGTPPPFGENNITFFKDTARWRDSTLLESMADGARQMWPKLGKRDNDTSMTIAVNQWQYNLPPLFSDANVRIIDVQLREIPSSTNRFEPNNYWTLTANNQLQFAPSQFYTPGATIMVVYEAPYSSLSQVESKAQMLPIWYAAGMLLGFKEAKRTRTDTQNVASEASANPPGAQQNAGAFYMRQFYTGLAQLSRVRKARRFRTTYQV